MKNNLNNSQNASIRIIIFLMFAIFLFLTIPIDNCRSQWVYQALPSYHDVSDIKFFDANTGVMILFSYDPGMLKTTNGGNNWTQLNNTYFYGMDKIDSTTLYAVAVRNGAYWLHRTFNKGVTWDSVYLPYTYRGISFINKDTGWISGANQLLSHAVFKTVNGGITFVQQTDTTGWGNLVFYKTKVNNEYIGWHYSSTGDNLFWKTTNGGVIWFQATRPPAQYLGYFQFYDNNTGWFTWNSNGVGGGIYKTTNGGINWNSQFVPQGNGIHNTFAKFKIINLDTIYGCGGYINYGTTSDFGIIWKTTNGGINWGYQIPDTSYHNGQYSVIDFINSNTGWAYQGHGVQTINGGGPITLTAIHNNNGIIEKDYILYQNFPNPFNPKTRIKYRIIQTNNVKLVVFDLLGKKIVTLLNKKQSAGVYEVLFDAGNLTSGIYFYSLFLNDYKKETKKMVIIK